MSAAREDREFHDTRKGFDVHSLGPFSAYPVEVNGWTVDLLQAMYRDDGTVEVSLDHRYMMALPSDLAAEVIEFVANAIAIARGWSCHPVSRDWTPDNDVAPVRLMPWHQMHGITTVEGATDDR